MFRDLKEYQEIAKIYAEKVSKPENLEERRGSSSAQLAQNRKDAFKPATPPQKGFGGGVGNPTNRRGSGAKPRKPEKKMSNIPVIDGPMNNPEYGTNMSRDEKDLNPEPKTEPKTTETKPDPKPMSTKDKFNSKFIKKVKGKGFVKRGTPGAQRAENKEKAKLRAKAMAKARLAKKAEMAKEDYTPYDFVLEYLLSTEQVATIEEANYVMTEMDGKTINDIVKEVTQSLEEGIGSVRILPALGKMALGAAAVKGISSYLGKKSGESSIKGSQQMKGGEKGGDPIKDLIPNLKKKKEATEKAIEKM